MQLRLALLSCALIAGPVLADCPTSRQMPSRVIFGDALVEEGFQITDENLESVTTFADGTVTIMQSAYGLYTRNLISGDTAMSWAWTPPDLSAPQDLPLEKDVVLSAVVTDPTGAHQLAIRYTFRSHGAEDLAVGVCRIAVIHLDQRQDFLDGSGTIVSQVWIDPERMIILKTERDKLDGSGAVVDHKASQATAFEL
ncbi:hypothetical protein [Neotabrizicola sp. sgz301269]|uniref:hypothetical protein n=1 Tax=Neotabrizicola sp. sgz301269 TaxID=3276282 RepID=UPI003770261F